MSLSDDVRRVEVLRPRAPADVVQDDGPEAVVCERLQRPVDPVGVVLDSPC